MCKVIGNNFAHSISSPVSPINIYFSKDDMFIGDTGEDIECAKLLEIKSCAVSWGILNENILKEYCPDIIVREVRELESYFL